MKENYSVVGLDIGSVTVSLVRMNPQGELVAQAGAVHNGEVRECVLRLLREAAEEGPFYLAATGVALKGLAAELQVNPQVALIRGARELLPGVRTILYVGGEKFGSLVFDESGNYRHAKGNTGCAAGTGSFLDQ